MTDPRQYYKKYTCFHPAWVAIHLAGEQIRNRARKYFTGKMLDIGCGDKAKQYLVGEYIEEHIGLDHEGCLHDMSNIDLIGTAYEIPEQDEFFDCILCTAVLEHLEEPQRALHEAYRVLKPGGYAIYTAPFFWHLHEEPRDFYRYTRFGLKHLFEKAKFEVLEVTPLSGFWVTFGSELNYYVSAICPGPLRYLSKFFIVINNNFFRFLDLFDQKFNGQSEKWAWMHLVLVRKPK